MSNPGNPPPDIEDFSSFPELCDLQTTVRQLDESPAWQAPKDPEVDDGLTGLETHENESTKMTTNLSDVKKVRITAKEILKRVMSTKSEKHGEGRQEYRKTPEVKRRVLLACRAYGLYGMHPNRQSIEAFKALAQSIIADKNDVEHVDTVAELREMVKACVISFKVSPDLLTKYPNQCQVIIQFGDFKKYFPEEFRILKDKRFEIKELL